MLMHPALPATHPITGAPVTPLGLTKTGRLIWPAMGGSQPNGDNSVSTTSSTGPVGQPQHHQAHQGSATPGPAPQPNPTQPPHGPGNPSQPVFPPQTRLNADGYPDHTPVQQMAPEEQAAYWRSYARRNEDRIKQMGDYTQLKEQADAYQKLLAQTQTEQEKAVTAAEMRGRQTALAEAGGQMVEAYVRAAATGRMNDEQVSALLQGLDRTRFVNPSSGQVDAQMINAYVAMLAPAVPAWAGAPAYAPPVPATGPGMPAAGNGYPQVPGMVPGVPGVAPQLTYPPQTQPVPGQQWTGVYPPQPQQQQQPGQQPAMGDARQVPSYGQAQFPATATSGFEAGKALARQRFGTTKPAQQ